MSHVFRVKTPNDSHVRATNNSNRRQHRPPKRVPFVSHKSRELMAMAVIALTLAGASPSSAASAQGAQNVSSYTSTAEKDCRRISKGETLDDGGIWLCNGPAGLAVVISESDPRETVSVGRNRKAAEREPAASAWFGPFSSTTPTIEWRSPEKGSPFAMIQRWHIADIADEDKTGRPTTKQMLVATRLPPGAVCHVAYIDVKANANANDLAREAADTLARGFKCGTDIGQGVRHERTRDRTGTAVSDIPTPTPFDRKVFATSA